jgi:flagellar hook-basal body complex protein FliE
MTVESIPGIASISSLNKTDRNASSTDNNGVSFGDYLKIALDEVNDLQQKASQSAEKLAMGDESYLHNTIIAYEKANLALQLTIEIRNKVVEAYQEIMRMQM